MRDNYFGAYVFARAETGKGPFNYEQFTYELLLPVQNHRTIWGNLFMETVRSGGGLDLAVVHKRLIEGNSPFRLFAQGPRRSATHRLWMPGENVAFFGLRILNIDEYYRIPTLERSCMAGKLGAETGFLLPEHLIPVLNNLDTENLMPEDLRGLVYAADIDVANAMNFPQVDLKSLLQRERLPAAPQVETPTPVRQLTLF